MEHALRIFAHAPRRTALPRPRREAPAVDRVVEPPAEPAPPSYEQHLLAILAGAPHHGETIDACYRRKERELAAVFAALARADAAALYRRLAEPRGDDPLAASFARLVVDRRTRLLAVLARRR